MAERRSLPAALAEALKNLVSRPQATPAREAPRAAADEDDDADAYFMEEDDDALADEDEVPEPRERRAAPPPRPAPQPQPQPQLAPAAAADEPVRSNLPVPIQKTGAVAPANGLGALRDKLMERTAGEVDLPVPGIGPMSVSRRVLLAGAGLGALAVAGLGFVAMTSGKDAAPPPAAQGYSFPPGFLWGATSSAFQIEGWDDLSGRGPSIWDEFMKDGAKVQVRTDPAVAIGHVARMPDDVALLKEIGLKAYSFSLSWSRLLPQGVGEINEDGFDFYDRLVDTLLEAGIEPWCCPHAWDLPEALQQRGGWLNSNMRDWFTDYVRLCEERFRDRIDNWSVFHDPAGFAYRGLALGRTPPEVADRNNFYNALHNINMSIARAVQALRTQGRGRVGITVRHTPFLPRTEADAQAATTLDVLLNRATLDPLLTGAYPQALQRTVQPLVTEDDLRVMRQALDFIGVQYLGAEYVQRDDAAPFLARIADAPPDAIRTAGGTLRNPAPFGEALERLHREYGRPLVAMGVGAVVDEPRNGGGGRLDDAERVLFMHSHLRTAHTAIQRGVNLQGFFAYSAFDQIEWTQGFGSGTGLIQVNPDTLERTPKRSATAFRDWARVNVLPRDLPTS